MVVVTAVSTGFKIWIFFHFPLAYSIQGQNVQMISPSSESHQQVVAVGQPLALQPQGTVMVSTTCKRSVLLTSSFLHLSVSLFSSQNQNATVCEPL